jgi:hypothetical protein
MEDKPPKLLTVCPVRPTGVGSTGKEETLGTVALLTARAEMVFGRSRRGMAGSAPGQEKNGAIRDIWIRIGPVKTAIGRR